MDTDVLVVGGGVAGAMSAIRLRERGLDCVIVERERMPREHIGESLTGEAGQRLREIGLEPAMAAAGFPVKHGVHVYGAHGGGSFWVPVMRRDDDGLAAAATWQVRREDFDALMLREAERRGARVVLGEAERPILEGDAVRGAVVESAGERLEIRSRWMLDASGMRTFLASSGVTGRKDRGSYDNQVAVYGRVRGALRDDGRAGGNTLIFYSRRNHWAWFIPLDEEVTSVGVVAPAEHVRARGEDLADYLLRELVEGTPEMRRRHAGIELASPVRTCSNYSYRVERYAGDGYLCVGDAHRFIDPIFSFGVHLALHEADRAVAVVERALDARPEERLGLAAVYEAETTRGMDRVQELVDAFWNNPLGFAWCVHSKYTADMTDLFAGRLYDEEDSPGLTALRKINRASRAAA